MSETKYIGSELQLFAKAQNWKTYWMTKAAPYIKGKVLEVGAGIGTNTNLLLKQQKAINKWVCLEPDLVLANEIKRNVDQKELHKLEVYDKYLTNFHAQETFDCILYIDVIEHIKDDHAELERAKNLLKPGGYLIILVPALESLYSEFDKTIGHFRRYDKKQLAKEVGQDLIKEKLMYLDTLGMLASKANKWILKQPYPFEKQIHFWDSYIIPCSKPLDKLLGYKMGKSLLGIWRSKS